MAEPMSQFEIEDVLSSIRRLVSEEPARAPAVRPVPLILTPALRVAMPETAPVVAQSAAPTLEDRIADLEATIARSAEEFEPDGSEDQITHRPQAVFRADPGADRTIEQPDAAPIRDVLDPPVAEVADEWEIETEPSVRALPERSAEDADADVAIDRKDGEPPPEFHETLIDEESLREIVADLVRQELRGDLGERITRNVRRMVRREVSRALALQGLEDDGEL